MEKIKAYKAFNKNLQCKGMQYEVGGEYEMPEEDVKICERGFHACESPFEVWDYYDLTQSRFCEVEQSGVIQRESDTSKTCASKIKIKAELNLADFIKVGIEWLKEKTSSGDSAKIGSSGDYAKIGSSGYSAQIGSSGDSAQIGSSGDYAQIGSSGYYAKIGSSGDYAQIDSTGQDSVICCAGRNSMVKAKIGSWITLAEWQYDDKKKLNVPTCVKTEYVDGERIKADTWYKLVGGKFVEE